MAKRTVVLVHGAFVTRDRPRMWRRGIVASMLLGAASGLRSQLGVAAVVEDAVAVGLAAAGVSL